MNHKQPYAEKETFRSISAGREFDETIGSVDQFENCIFVNCDFSGADLNGKRFIECLFDGCNLTMAATGGTLFADAVFAGCKMLGLRFDHCNNLGMEVKFDSCVMDHSCFQKVRIPKTSFMKCRLHGVDMSGADLSQCVFGECDFTDAVFEETNISGADFASSFNFTIDPAKNKIRKAVFSRYSLAGLLAAYGIVVKD